MGKLVVPRTGDTWELLAEDCGPQQRAASRSGSRGTNMLSFPLPASGASHWSPLSATSQDEGPAEAAGEADGGAGRGAGGRPRSAPGAGLLAALLRLHPLLIVAWHDRPPSQCALKCYCFHEGFCVPSVGLTGRHPLCLNPHDLLLSATSDIMQQVRAPGARPLPRPPLAQGGAHAMAMPVSPFGEAHALTPASSSCTNKRKPTKGEKQGLFLQSLPNEGGSH